MACMGVQAGFEKMEVTGRFELPEELLQLERSGMLQAEAFDRTRTLTRTPHSPPVRSASSLNPSPSTFGLEASTSFR